MKADSHIQRRAAIKGLTPKLKRLIIQKIFNIIFVTWNSLYYLNENRKMAILKIKLMMEKRFSDPN